MTILKRRDQFDSGKKKTKNSSQRHGEKNGNRNQNARIYRSETAASTQLQPDVNHGEKSISIGSGERRQGNIATHKRKQIKFVYPRRQQTYNGPLEFLFSGAMQNADTDIHDKDKDHVSQNYLEVSNSAMPRRKESLEDILYPNRIKLHESHKVSDISHITTPLKATGTSIKRDMKVPPKEESRDEGSNRKRSILEDFAMSETPPPAFSGFSVEDAIKDSAGCRPRANSTDGELNLPQRGLCDERMVLAAHKWGTSWKSSNPRGFVNLGNTCFLNATLQCLVYLPTFCQSLDAMKLPMKQKLSSGQKFASILQSLVRQGHGIETSPNCNQSPSGAIAPRTMVHAIPMLGQIGSKKGYKFRPGRQEDAHEFLIHLIDAMQDGELKAAGIDQTARGWRDSMPIPRLDETTFIHRIFGGYFRSQVRCSKCNYRSNTYDPFLDLSLEVSKTSCNSLLSAFSEFSRKERLDKQNQWRCSGCNKHVRASKQLTVFRPPLSLCIQLKRFTYGGGAYGGFHKKMSYMSGGGGGKINKPIEFPSQLALPLSDGRNCEYSLTGIVVHVGGTSSSGHYTAYVRKPQNQSTQWYHMDDSFVEAVSEKTVLRQRDAYVLFYCRNEVKLELPTPPPRSNMTAEQATAHGQARARARAESISKETEFETKPKVQKSGEAVSVVGFSTPTKITPSETKARGTLPNKQGVGHPVEPFKSKGKMLESSAESSHDSSDSSDESSDNEDDKAFAKATVKPEGKVQVVVGLSTATVAAFSVVKTAPLVVGKHEQMVDTSLLSKSKYQGPDSSCSSDDSSEAEADPIEPATKEETPSSSSTTTSSSSNSTDEGSNLEFMKNAGVVEGSSEESTNSDEASISGGEVVISTSSTTEANSGFGMSEPNPLSVVKERNPAHDGKPSKPIVTRKSEIKTRVVFDRGSTHGKLEVMMGPRFKTKKAWKPKASIGGNKDDKHDLLGTIQVGKWDEDEVPVAQVDRTKVVKTLARMETDRKRTMHLDRWDAILDHGKQKKVKNLEDFASQLSKEPKFNPFSRIQSSIQRFNKGLAKGVFRSESTGNGRPGNPSRSPKGRHGRAGIPKNSPKFNKRKHH